MLNKKTINDVSLQGRKVIMRVDYNVPLDGDRITDALRVEAAMPTVQAILAQGASLILMSHLGRPKGKPDAKYSLKPVYAWLKDHLKAPVLWADDCVGDAAKNAAAALKPGEVLLLENLRFHAEEEKNDPAFAKELASLAEVYVNDAFGTAHRAHASTEGITHFLSPSVAGLLMVKELEYLENALESPKRPFIGILGGAKVSDKIPVIERLLDRVDSLIIGGGMAFTFLKAKGVDVRGSKLEADFVGEAARLMKLAKEKGKALLLPSDVVAAPEVSDTAPTKVCSLAGAKESADGMLSGIDPAAWIPEGWMGLDIGPETSKLFSTVIMKCGTCLWNGPQGVFETKAFAAGTEAVARAIADSGCISVAGGGDTASAVKVFGLQDKFTHVSTGGGASLELLEGKKLPGVEALTDK